MAKMIALYGPNGEVAHSYPATVQEWLDYGYTLQPPAGVKAQPVPLEQRLPTAGREADRVAPIINKEGETLGVPTRSAMSLGSPGEPTTTEFSEAPKKAPPKRRAAAPKSED